MERSPSTRRSPTANPRYRARHRRAERPGRRRLRPRRYGKSSSWRVSQQAIAQEVLVAHVNLMTTPTRASPRSSRRRSTTTSPAESSLARERLRVFAGLRITPIVTVDPTLGQARLHVRRGPPAEGHRRNAGAGCSSLRQLAEERGRGKALVLDEFQEVVDDRPRASEADALRLRDSSPTSRTSTWAASATCSERIFNDENEPFMAQREADGAPA